MKIQKQSLIILLAKKDLKEMIVVLRNFNKKLKKREDARGKE
jgi:hypothetical protein